MDWIWKLCNRAFEDFRSAMIVSMLKDKGEMTEYKIYRDISFFTMVGKI